MMLRSALRLARPAVVSRAAAVRFASTTSAASADADMPPHEHHSPSAKPPPPPPGVEVDPMIHGYPQLPAISLQTRSPYGWWDRQERKNFDEVVHEEEDALSMWSPDLHRVEAHKAAMGIAIMLSLVAGFAYYVTAHRPQRKATARDYPYGGLEKELGGRSKAREEPIDDVE